MTMWTPKADVESDFSDFPGTDLPNKPRRSRRRAWRDGLAEQTVAKNFEDIRASRAFERAIIGNVDPRSAIELALVHRLANLFWRLRRASAVETGLLEARGERRLQDPSGGPSQRRALPSPNGHGKVRGSYGPHEPDPCLKSHTIAESFLRLSNRDPTCLTEWAGMKRDCGAKRCKQSGRLTR
jgi:hypothetical protein